MYGGDGSARALSVPAVAFPSIPPLVYVNQHELLAAHEDYHYQHSAERKGFTLGEEQSIKTPDGGGGTTARGGASDLFLNDMNNHLPNYTISQP
jgi:hypothetical protein